MNINPAFRCGRHETHHTGKRTSCAINFFHGGKSQRRGQLGGCPPEQSYKSPTQLRLCLQNSGRKMRRLLGCLTARGGLASTCQRAANGFLSYLLVFCVSVGEPKVVFFQKVQVFTHFVKEHLTSGTFLWETNRGKKKITFAK